MASAVALPFENLPLPWDVLFAIAFVVICAMLAWTTTLFVRGIEFRSDWDEEERAARADAFTWVFFTPALNEEITIRDSVERLLALPLARKRVVVIDDGSDDATPAVLAAMDDPRLHVIRREAPEARQGKAAALNDAYGRLDELLPEVPREQVILCVVDADGRLAPDAPARVTEHFEDERVGGVQVLVRIYNRRGLLTWLQDVEFSVYGFLYQAGRNLWGTAGMGGNGQFNRLSALDAVADREGPWRDRLTEDQDLGLRLIAAGWLGRQELTGAVEQQGLSSPRRLFRQRTRWSQGNLQAMGLLPSIWRGDISFIARFEQALYLLLPVWQSIIGISLLGAAFLAITGKAPLIGDFSWWQLLFIYVLGFGGVLMGCLARAVGRGFPALLTGLLVAQLYAVYSWMLWPVLVRSVARQLTARRGWEKTSREPLTPSSTQVPSG